MTMQILENRKYSDTCYIDEGLELTDYRDREHVHIELVYPRSNRIKVIEIGLCDVRASDDIRIEYDFGRDGWKISQYDCSVENEEWKESAFIPAWQYEKKEI